MEEDRFIISRTKIPQEAIGGKQYNDSTLILEPFWAEAAAELRGEPFEEGGHLPWRHVTSKLRQSALRAIKKIVLAEDKSYYVDYEDSFTADFEDGFDYYTTFTEYAEMYREPFSYPLTAARQLWNFKAFRGVRSLERLWFSSETQTFLEDITRKPASDLDIRRWTRCKRIDYQNSARSVVIDLKAREDMMRDFYMLRETALDIDTSEDGGQ